MPDARRPSTDSSAYRAKDEFYAYDNLNRLVTWKRGDLNVGKTDITSPVESQTWDFDALGNWQSTVIDTVTQNRTHNAQNQIKTVNTANLVWSGNGELTTDESGTTLTYDAWGRVVEIDPAGAAPAVAHAYDAANRRISEGSGELFYSADWQVIEEFDGSGEVVAKHYWATNVYVDALIARSDPQRTLSENELIFVHQDRMFNVTALSNDLGDAIERFQYRAYGEQAVLENDWSVDGDGVSDLKNKVGFLGRPAMSVLCEFRSMFFHRGLGSLSIVKTGSTKTEVRQTPDVARWSAELIAFNFSPSLKDSEQAELEAALPVYVIACVASGAAAVIYNAIENEGAIGGLRGGTRTFFAGCVSGVGLLGIGRVLGAVKMTGTGAKKLLWEVMH